VTVNINDGQQAVGHVLLVLFFVMSAVKTCGGLTFHRLVLVGAIKMGDSRGAWHSKSWAMIRRF